MIHKVLLTTVVAVVFGASAQIASAFPAATLSHKPVSEAQKVTFWGNAFPYGYRWSYARACTEYRTIETPRGPVVRRVWVCGGRRYGGAVVSYRN